MTYTLMYWLLFYGVNYKVNSWNVLRSTTASPHKPYAFSAGNISYMRKGKYSEFLFILVQKTQYLIMYEHLSSLIYERITCFVIQPMVNEMISRC